MKEQELKSIKFSNNDIRYTIPDGVSSPVDKDTVKQVGQVRENNGKLEYALNSSPDTWKEIAGGGSGGGITSPDDNTNVSSIRVVDYTNLQFQSGGSADWSNILTSITDSGHGEAIRQIIKAHGSNNLKYMDQEGKYHLIGGTSETILQPCKLMQNTDTPSRYMIYDNLNNPIKIKTLFISNLFFGMAGDKVNLINSIVANSERDNVQAPSIMTQAKEVTLSDMTITNLNKAYTVEVHETYLECKIGAGPYATTIEDVLPDMCIIYGII